MNTLFGSMSDGAWLPFLLDMSLKALVVLLLAIATTSALRAASASLRHHVWTLAFVAVLALPFLAASLPSWRVSMPSWVVPNASVPAASIESAVLPDDGVSAAGRPRLTEASLETSAPTASVVTARTANGVSSGSVIRTIFGVWLIGVALMLTRLAVGVGAACWTSRRAEELDHLGWRRLVDELSAELGIGPTVRLLTSASISTPMAWGVFRPALLLPSDARSWSVDRRRAVALHELAHIKRRDCLVHLLAQAARAVHWFNPLAWVGATRLRAERERACDDLVLTSGTRSADYAKLLLDVARGRMNRSLAWATVSMARPSELEGRLLAILDPARDRRGMGRPAAVAAIGLAAGVMLPLAAFQAAPEPPAPPAVAEPAPEPRAPLATEPAVAPEPPRAHRLPSAFAPEPPVRPDMWPLPRLAPVPLPSLRAVGEPPYAPAVADTLEERAAAAMIQALGSERENIRSQAAHALGSLEMSLAVGPLGETLRRDESARVRSQAAWALGTIESADGVSALIPALRDESAEVRNQAAWALGMIESADGVSALIPVLRDESVDVRNQAAWALGMIESAEAVDGLIAALGSDESADVRNQAAWALGMIEDSSATDALIDAIEDENDGVAEQAMWALGQLIG